MSLVENVCSLKRAHKRRHVTDVGADLDAEVHAVRRQFERAGQVLGRLAHDDRQQRWLAASLATQARAPPRERALVDAVPRRDVADRATTLDLAGNPLPELTRPTDGAHAASVVGRAGWREGSIPVRLPPGDAMRAGLRAERSRAVVEKLEKWIRSTQTLPQSALRKAIEYTTGLWTGLTRFLEDPRIPLSNNHTERSLRGPVVGRKNHYGSRSRRGTDAAAILYSLVESAKLAGVDPQRYLHDAIHAALRGKPLPLPHEIRDRAAD